MDKVKIKCSEGAEPIMRSIITRKCYLCDEIWQMTSLEYIFNKVGRIVHDFSDNGNSNGDDWLCPKCAERIIKIKNL